MPKTQSLTLLLSIAASVICLAAHAEQDSDNLFQDGTIVRNGEVVDTLTMVMA